MESSPGLQSHIIECQTVRDILDNFGLNEPFYVHTGGYEQRLVRKAYAQDDYQLHYFLETVVNRLDPVNMTETITEIEQRRVTLDSPYTNRIQPMTEVCRDNREIQSVFLLRDGAGYPPIMPR